MAIKHGILAISKIGADMDDRAKIVNAGDGTWAAIFTVIRSEKLDMRGRIDGRESGIVLCRFHSSAA